MKKPGSRKREAQPVENCVHMSLIKRCLQKLGIGKRAKSLIPLDAEALRTAFQTRYHNFKLLLSANNKALQIMSELEEARKGDRPFGMSFIRANCTAVSVNVFRMVKCMESLRPASIWTSTTASGRFRAGSLKYCLKKRKRAAVR